MPSSSTRDAARLSLIRSVTAGLITAILFALVVIGLSTAPAADPDRVAALGERIRCPVCQNESIADSPSETARQMMMIVREKVEQGESNREIEDFFIARYGEWVILDPPVAGRFLPLWGLPMLAVVVGGVAIARRRRGASTAEGDLSEEFANDHPDELISQANRDLAELTEQVEVGEIDPAVADRLRGRYELEIETAERAKTRTAGDGSGPEGRSRLRSLVGWGIGILAMLVVVVMVTQMVQERSGPDVAVGTGLDESSGQDLSQVSNEEMEAVLAENPDIGPMRMALADRYFSAGELEPALGHYLEVLKSDPAEADAWARLGWVVYQLGEADLAVQYLERSLAHEPGKAEAEFYLGLVYLYGQADPQAALPFLKAVASRDNVPADIRKTVEGAISDAEASLGDR